MKRWKLLLLVVFVVLAVLIVVPNLLRSRLQSSMYDMSPRPAMGAIGAEPERAASYAGAPAAPMAAQLGALGYVDTAGKGLMPTVNAAEVSTESVAASQVDRYLVKNVTMQVEVEDTRAAADQLTGAARTAAGYLGNMQESVDGLGGRSINLELRVPVAQFDAFMAKVEAIGKVLSKQVNAEDVTEQYIDTDARLRNLKATEQRLLDHLSKSLRLEDTLRAEQEITRTRGQIEQLEAKLRFLSHRIAFSTFRITLQTEPHAGPVTPAATFSSGQVASEATRSLVGFLQRVWVRAIWIGVWTPVWLPVLLVVALIQRAFRRHRAV